ncbi:nucleotidyltransferase [Streptomyces albicerus]|uniref:nucleotidyltransferase n=1 Tax=Streptomyces albicerus TaxID=2569859 RepID=UPI00124AFA6F|nr:nucleotidyltransferase [Streptomyces albicerus]
MVHKESLASLVDEGRRKIQVTDEELDEAKRRRRLLATSARRAFPGSTSYFNGSVAHGDANTPLTDVDLGVVLAEEDAEPYGPGKKSALALMETVRDVIHDDLDEEFPALTIEVIGRRRAVLVRFGEPVTDGQPDFTADVMTAIPHPSGRGLYIPNTKTADQWDRADPITHTKMVLKAIKDTKVVFARTVRLLKHWNGTHSKPMCSWNIKALALGCLDEPMPLIDALQVFFTYAAAEIDKGPTPDPAGVAGPIPLNMPRHEVHKRLCTARDYVDLAIEHEAAGRPLSAQHALHQVLPELVPDADATQEEADRLASTVRSGGTAATGLGLAVGLVTPTRAWGI